MLFVKKCDKIIEIADVTTYLYDILLNMKSLILKILIIVTIFSFWGIAFAWVFVQDNVNTQPYCNWQPGSTECSLDNGTKIAAKWIPEINQQEKFSQYIQRIANYTIWFVALLWVLLIIFAWFNIMTSNWDDTKAKKSKSVISYVFMWMAFIFLAYSIVTFIIQIIIPTNSILLSNIRLPNLVEQSYAYTSNDKNTFDEYKKAAEEMASSLEQDYKVNNRISASNLTRLQQIVNNAILTLPDDENYISNTNIAKNLLISIQVVQKTPDSSARITELARSLSDFLNKIKVPRITATISATPQSWSAPLNVSLRASNVLDPSWVVIPNANFIWWVKDSSWNRRTLWTWPSINYTFKEEKSYLVNLDIVSASKNTNGKIDTLPFNWQIKVDVLPSAGDINLYINWNNVSDLDKLKITPWIWKAWLIFDATASQPATGTRFTKTFWDFSNWNTVAHDLSPHIEKQYFTNEWNYKVTLQLTTNEGKIITKTMYIEVRDPVASIKTDKNSWFVWDDFKFSVNTSFYDWQLNYEWKIIELSNNWVLFTSSNENVSYKFRNTWKFAIKLKSRTPSWREDIDTVVVNIDSRDPIADFETSQLNRETPNTYKFDATTSYDPDTFDSSKLSFNWLIDGQKVELENPSRNWAVGKYTFNTEWTHKITLEVSNRDWKTTTAKKTITVESLLSVKLWFSPKIVKIGSSVSIVADSKEASIFEWNFWDSSTDTTNVWRISHTYKKSWTYDLTLTVRWPKWSDSNFITRKIYVSDWLTPSSSITITKDNEEVLPTDSACDSNSAFVLDRASAVTFSAENSVNVDWTTNWLVYSWKYVWRNSSQQRFSYKFDELGCFPIDLTVKSQKTWKLSSSRVFVKVENLAPKVNGLTLTPTDLNSDPVVVKVTANNAHDDDGVIVSYLWYYYTDSDPEPQDYRVTRVPSTTFVLPKITWKYYFVLIAEDSNWAKINTEQVSEERYSLQLSTDNINTPLLKLSADKTSISTWDEVNFEVKVSDVLWRDISDKVEYKWDYDGDWFYDDTTKSWKMTHKFTTSWNINFKVKVTYKWISNSKYQLISVKNVLKPNFEYYAIWKKLVLFNTSLWNYTTATWDLWNNITSNNLNSFAYDFSNDKFPTSVSLKVSDWTTSQSIDIPVKVDVINKLKLSRSKWNLALFTYPLISDNEIHLDNSNNKVFLYLWESKWNIGSYCIDTDISVDTDLNWTADDDCDNKWTDSYTSWAPFVITDFNSNIQTREIKITLFDWKKAIESKSIKVVQDNVATNSDNIKTTENKNISEADKLSIEELKDLIKKSSESERLQMMKFLSTLQENWFDDREKTKVIIDFESYINSSSLEQVTKDKFYNILEWFLVTDKQTKTDITLAVKVLKTLIPKSNPKYEQIMKNIDEILSHPTNTTINKDLWKFILEAIKDDNNISTKDKNIIKSQLQVIIYGSQKNVPTSNSETQDDNSSSWILGFLLSVLKIFGYIIWLLILWFLWLFWFFKVSNKNDNLSFQDFLIELFTGQKVSDNENSTQDTFVMKPKEDVLSNIPNNVTVEESKTETLSQDENIAWEVKTDSFVNSKIADFDKKNLFEAVQDNNSWDNKLPDWLKWVSDSWEESSISDQYSLWNEDASIKDTPDFDKSSSLDAYDTSKDMSNEETHKDFLNDNENKKIPEDISSESDSQTQDVVSDDWNLPAWLQWIDKDELNKEIEDELNKEDGIESEESLEDIINNDEEKLAESLLDNSNSNKEDILSQVNDSQSSLASDDWLPDWLKWSVTEHIADNNIVENEITVTQEPVIEPVNKVSNKQKIEKSNNQKSWKSWDKSSSKKENNSLDTIKSVKPISKKPKMFTDKKPDKVLKETTQVTDDELPDWLK